jgi:hypothetical protein
VHDICCGYFKYTVGYLQQVKDFTFYARIVHAIDIREFFLLCHTVSFRWKVKILGKLLFFISSPLLLLPCNVILTSFFCLPFLCLVWKMLFIWVGGRQGINPSHFQGAGAGLIPPGIHFIQFKFICISAFSNLLLQRFSRMNGVLKETSWSSSKCNAP